MTDVVTLNGERIDLSDARQIIAGYCFGAENVDFRPPRGNFGDPPPLGTRARWAYRTYDCIDPDPGPQLGMTDLLVAAGINGELNQRRVASLLHMAPLVGEALQQVDPSTTFWALDEPPDDPDETSQREWWWVYRAWWLLMGSRDIDVTITHKVLHHKRPELVPLLDRPTLSRLPKNHAWQQIHRDLRESQEGWDELERWFVPLAARSRGVPLRRLRMYDILLWCQTAKGQWDAAAEAGSQVLSRS